MLFEEFSELLVEELQESIGESGQVTKSSICKNNGVQLAAVSIMKKDLNISPTIYINDYYREFMDGMKMEEIIEDILRVHRTHQCEKAFQVEDFMNLEYAKKGLAYKLIHYDKNKALLKEVPHIHFLDLAIVFFCLMETNDWGRGTIMIHNSHLEMWGITKEELVRLARENAPKILPYDLVSMRDILQEMLAETLFQEQLEELENPAMYVLSNQYRCFGAATILYPDMLSDFARAAGSNLVIIPSSVHEVILIPVEEGTDLEEFSIMVEEVNATQVDAQEVLADHVYYFDRATGEISIP